MKEADIRPKELFDKYLSLSKEDGATLERSEFVVIPCPACGDERVDQCFHKDDYRYVTCSACHSLYSSPRPSEAQLSFLYSASKSSAYWSQVFFPTVAEARQEKLFAPKARKVAELVGTLNLPEDLSVCDIGAGHGFFLSELNKLLPKSRCFAVEPDATSAQVCRDKGFGVLESTAEKAEAWSGRFDLVLSSEVIEHVYDPATFVRSLADLTKPGGYLLMTGLGYEGFDILTLGARSKSVAPPHHLNFFSVEGFEILLGKAGFRDVKVWTPGKLDVDIVMGMGDLEPFAAALKRRGPETLEAFQKFLVDHRLSSHVWVLAQS